MSAKRNLKPECADNSDQHGVEESDEEERQRLAKNELDRADWRHHDLFQCSDFAFPNHGKRCERDDEQRGETADYTRDKKPAAAEIRVIPGALFKLNRRKLFG